MSLIIKMKSTLVIAFAVASVMHAVAQNGYSMVLSDQNAELARANLDDIIMHDDHLLVRGNIFDDSAGLLGLLVTELDTFGNIAWYQVYTDSIYNSSYISNTPTRFRVADDDHIYVPNYFWNGNELGLTILEPLGNELVTTRYSHSGKTIFPGDVFKVGNDLYLFGYVQRNDFKGDCYVVKTDSIGVLKWFKYYGLEDQEEVFGDVIMSSDSTFTISSRRASQEFYLSDSTLVGWWSPWVFTIDLDGNIVDEWLGEENDTTTLAGGPLYHMPNGDYTLISRDFDVVNDEGEYHLFFKPIITRLDSDFRMIWKKELINYFWPANRIVDIEYDITRDEFVLGGVKTVIYTEEHSEHEIWAVKLDGDGNTIWDITDTIYSEKYAFHETAGLVISPTGSIYMSGYAHYHNGPYEGWILKITADGCSDTLCTTTSLEDQIRNWDKNASIFPNPTSTELNIAVQSLDGPAYFQLFDINGRRLLKEKVIKGQNRIELDAPPGVYISNISDGNRILHAEKLVIIK